MRRESLKLQESDWQRLDQLAAATGSEYSGKPSWRRLILRIARGEGKMTHMELARHLGRTRLAIKSRFGIIKKTQQPITE